MPENLTSINIGLLGQLKSVRVCLIHPILKNLQRGHPCKHIYFTYISRDYIGIFQQFILLVYLL